jgi:hypothetical protein
MSKWILLCPFVLLGAVWSCSSNSPKCVAGQSAACAGPGGCSGFQVCGADGTYGACQCSGVDAGSSDGGTADGGPTDSGAADSGNGWRPTQLSGLVLWLKNGGWVLDGGSVAGWKDNSGRGHDMVTNRNAPIVDPAAIGGLSALGFASNSTTSMTTTGGAQTDFEWDAGNFVIAVVGKANSGPFLSAVDGANPIPVYLGISTDAGIEGATGFIASQSVSTSQLAADSPHVFTLRRTGNTSAELRVDGVPTAFTLPAGTNLSYPETLNIGAYSPILGTTTTFLDGDVGEVVAATAPSDSDVTQLEAYLRQTFGL